MRDITFRGIRKGSKDFLIGDLNHIDGTVYIFPRGEDVPCNSTDWFEVEPNTVGQATGIPDRNHCEIYEGDIIGQIFHPEKSMAYITFETLKGWCFNYIDPTYKRVRGLKPEPISPNIELFKIIGNVHQNPELLSTHC
jgi:uncharacterized phage protein (TIGR01671 family)